MNKTRPSSSSSGSKEGVKWRIFPSLAMGGGGVKWVYDKTLRIRF